MGRETHSSTVDFTMLVCTYNRAADLRELLETAVRQETGGEFSYEILVVDNNSTDETPGGVAEFIRRGCANVRYMREERQGKSHALITGLAHARGEFYVITDDDFVLPADWLRKIHAAFQRYPEVACVSGKVLPLWQSDPPAWLTPRHWSAIAMADYGAEEFYADSEKPICLLACAFRRRDVLAVGGYHQELGVNAGNIGGTEDLEILQRLWAAGRKGVYVPTITFLHKVTPERMTKHYHRRWHTGHGGFYAVMRDPDFERSGARLFDVPAHLYRQAAANAALWVKHVLRRDSAAAFERETELRFFAGFLRRRRADHAAAGGASAPRELVRFARALVTSKTRRGASGSVPSGGDLTAGSR